MTRGFKDWLKYNLPSHLQQGVIISKFVLFPLSFEVTSPEHAPSEYLTDPAIRLVVEFFRAKGLAKLKQEDREEAWYQDWIDYQAAHGLYASLLSPKEFSTRGHHFDLLRLARFAESIAYFSPAHGYSLQVSFLGIFPIYMGSNEALKREAVELLEAGGLFAFAVSERRHGSDLMANEFVLQGGPAGKLASGMKSYIGNANAAGIISVLAREIEADAVPGKRAPFVFFALRPHETPGLVNLRKIRTLGIRTAFVGEFEVRDHPVAATDIISRQREAWAAVFGTVDFGKFFLGFGAIGICEHAFAEGYAHLQTRILYGKPVAALAHIRDTTVIAFGRLVAMKLYAYRALDYLQAAGPDDRRYMLFNAVQKARVSTEGVKVLHALSECVGARGFEQDTYLESALREGSMIPALEGSTHINFLMAAQFAAGYFAGPGDNPPTLPRSVTLGETGSDENPYWTKARDRHPRTVHFRHHLAAYEPLQSVPNVRLFVLQVEAFGRVVACACAAPHPEPESDRQIALGRCLAVVVYAQLIAENCSAGDVAAEAVSAIFHGLIEDLTAESLALAALYPPADTLRSLLKEVICIPQTSVSEMEAVMVWIASLYPHTTSGSTDSLASA